MAVVFFYATLGGMKGITWTQVVQYCVLIVAFLIPAVAISYQATGNPLPQVGMGEVLRLEIDPQLIERGEQDMIEDLVPAAVNQALRKARETHGEMMKSMTSGIDLPGLDNMLAKFTGQENSGS